MAQSEAFIYMGLGLVIIIIRMWARWSQVGPPNWQLDDYLMPLTGVVLALKTITVHVVAATFDGLTNSYMTDEERAALDPNSTEYFNRQWGSKIQLIAWSFYAFILWASKFCVTVFYGRLTSGLMLMHLRLRVQIAYVLLGVTYTFVALSLLLACGPTSKYWQINPNPGDLCLPASSKFRVFTVLIPNIITDVYLLSIPLPLLWVANIGLRRKISLMVLFSGAVFVVIAGIARGVSILQAGPEGAVTGSEWACRETFVAIVVTNLPIIQPFFRKAATRIGSSALFTKATRSTDNYPRGSEQSGGGIGAVRGTHPPSLPRSSSITSDQSALNYCTLDGYKQSPGGSGSIVVSREFTVVRKGMAMNQERNEKMWFTERVNV
ncbi:hypothetical protein F4821DRAFT_169535 [Hypoxylon rubiginosum]|uniref:Uncharacterized protein n=1 Tax=Hypoxylon rubiginosum TaxID=110542 RepID=A0ACC0CVS2_9PEZI|nr:hypothetical protein F4821DRAFT_169535 [Hypoxylon rubiginosum]